MIHRLTKQSFKRRRFPALIILTAVQMYLRYPLSYQDVADLLYDRDIDADRSTVFHWVQKFGPELAIFLVGHRFRRSAGRLSVNSPT